MLSILQFPDRPQRVEAARGPCIAAIYGFASREHMQRHLLAFVRAAGYSDTTLYGHAQARLMADDLQQAASQGRPIVLIGFSQGGFEAMTVARELKQRGVRVDLMVLIAARGIGRLLPRRWGADMRHVPENVALCLNYFAEGDVMGSDRQPEANLVCALAETTRIENIAFTRDDNISHVGLSRCYPRDRLQPILTQRLHDRLLAELSALQELGA